MMTTRMSLVTLAGLMSTFLVIGSPGLPGSALAQPTQSEIKAKAKATAKKTPLKWDSLSPEQQEHLKTVWKTDAQKTQEKWDAMTAEQQQQFIAKAKAQGQKTREKWRSLPKQ